MLITCLLYTSHVVKFDSQHMEIITPQVAQPHADPDHAQPGYRTLLLSVVNFQGVGRHPPPPSLELFN